jgi:hypothetical protein
MRTRAAPNVKLNVPTLYKLPLVYSAGPWSWFTNTVVVPPVWSISIGTFGSRNPLIQCHAIFTCIVAATGKYAVYWIYLTAVCVLICVCVFTAVPLLCA